MMPFLTQETQDELATLAERYGQPLTRSAITLPMGLTFCGDGFVGGRFHLALEHGIKVAQQLIDQHL